MNVQHHHINTQCVEILGNQLTLYSAHIYTQITFYTICYLHLLSHRNIINSGAARIHYSYLNILQNCQTAISLLACYIKTRISYQHNSWINHHLYKTDFYISFTYILYFAIVYYAVCGLRSDMPFLINE